MQSAGPWTSASETMKVKSIFNNPYRRGKTCCIKIVYIENSEICTVTTQDGTFQGLLRYVVGLEASHGL